MVRAARFVAALLAGIFLAGPLPAAPEPPVENRFLLIFDTSSAMKKREPAVENAIDNLLATSLRGELHEGDSIGVWTFDKDLRTGEFPLMRWDPPSAAAIAEGLKDFLRKHRYAGETSFAALQPFLDGVVKNSQRLTVLIFCDGQSEINWTPYDNAINKALGERQAERKKNKQPFILLLRSQLGEYVGCTVGLPPELIGFPQFPPLPAPEIKPVPPAPTNAPPVVPQSTLPPLVIIGTKVGTNLPPPELQSAPTNVPAVSNIVAGISTNLPPAEIKPAPPAISPEPTPVPPVEFKPAPPAPPPTALPLPLTNLPPAPPTSAVAEPVVTPTNVIAETAVAPTNAFVPPAESADTGYKKLLLIGGGLLVAAIGLATLLLLRPRHADRTSLITSSMNQDPRPPRKN